ncbi:MAG: glycosyltransferase, partial [Candidatus Andersenbacteria bacterium]|nr:glycosyltransferase [Candidatus Andersenbacteria bacterium]
KRWPDGPDVVWSYTPFLSRLAELFPEATSVFDAVDEWREHQAYQDRREELSEHYERIAQTYDTVFTVSQSVHQDLFANHTNATWISNGIDADHFAPFDITRWDQEDKEGFMRAKRAQELPQPVLGYVGVIENRVDAELLTTVSEAFPGGSLVLVGPSWRKDTAWNELIAKPNVHVFGEVPYSSAPWVSSQFDVALIPHKVNKFTQSMNPMKLYEYLSMGLPVVSTPVAGLDGFDDGVRIATTPAEFVQAVQEAIQDVTPKAERRRLVQGHAWSDRVDRMFELIDL